jgi:hypothetical protein
LSAAKNKKGVFAELLKLLMDTVASMAHNFESELPQCTYYLSQKANPKQTIEMGC